MPSSSSSSCQPRGFVLYFSLDADEASSSSPLPSQTIMAPAEPAGDNQVPVEAEPGWMTPVKVNAVLRRHSSVAPQDGCS
ncbi:hypothetical protein CDD81_8095 [Ophiocordyceps australis]|uniref:Uncharacterized protein n=1 Tax=Ophiocordyceps australis TaxID=1399860 RepID=A0A2C5Y421_9HYPO|nr:hypothetical protein CDD81_8095 [Ophiocordyceps australis]